MRAATKFDRDRLCLQPSCLIVCRGIPGTRCIAFSKAQFCRRGLSHPIACAGHAGAGCARRRAMSDWMSLNFRRDTRPSAI